ncbi:hypothetical protein [Sulfitobacter dubius]|uniref:hypothetical protein n=1 Tax=Sulfitobacter dubius TaxID=218673 RepID=UPI0022B036F4|nr:hypothetical protein [Sulfitobacter dubius]MCZ4366636.1 hypothetical protein [Sulfitobacter dubius]
MAEFGAEDWAWEYVANDIRDRIGNRGESLRTISHVVFDHEIGAPDGKRLYLTDPDDQRPALYIERVSDDEYDLVIVWDGAEKYRNQMETQLEGEIQRFL